MEFCDQATPLSRSLISLFPFYYEWTGNVYQLRPQVDPFDLSKKTFDLFLIVADIKTKWHIQVNNNAP